MELPLTIKTKSLGIMNDEQFYRFCLDNEPLNFERNANGEIIVMAPTYTLTDFWNTDIIAELRNWNKQSKLGYVFGNNAGFSLPNGAVRSPDAAWVSKERMAHVAREHKKGFTKVTPDFIVELVSESDSIEQLKAKMEEWMANGCLLGWLIDQKTSTVFVYEGSNRNTVSFSKPISGGVILPGFEVDLKKIFDQEY